MFGIPPGPPSPGGSQSFINAQGFVVDRVPGFGMMQRTRFGIPVRDLGPTGIPRMAPTIGPRQPERMLGGPAITGPNGEPLFKRAPGSR